MKNVVFIAPPAAGKGTQSKELERLYNYVYIATGDLLRNIDPNTDLGKKVNQIMNSGELVGDEIITELLKEKLTTVASNFILDGYPRNVNQAAILDELFERLNIKNIIVVYLDIDEDTAKKRMLGRMNCLKCNVIYNKYYDKAKPKVEGKCDICNSELDVRVDDTEEAFTKRFQIYLNNTKPVLDYYKEKGLLKIVKVSDEKQETFTEIVKCVSGEE